MRKKKTLLKKTTILGLMTISCSIGLWNPSQIEIAEAEKSVATHIGTFEGSTTFRTSSRNGINPGLFIEVMDEYGNLTQYESEEGVITIPNTKEGAYITQAKLLGKTKYIDQNTGEVLDEWEDGRNLRLASSEMPDLTITGMNLFDKNTLTLNHQLHSNGGLYANSEMSVSDFIKVTPLTNYVRTNSDYTGFYDINKNFIEFIRTGKEFTIPESVHYIRFNTYNELIDTQVLVEGSTLPIIYAPYQSSALSPQEELVLRSLTNGVRDELNLMTGEVIQRVNKTVLDGTQPIQEHTVANWNNDVVYGVLIDPLSNDIKAMTKDGDGKLNFLSDRFVFCYSKMDIGAESEGMSHHGPDNKFRLSITNSKLTSQDADGVAQWLQANPVTVQYEFATPITKIIQLNSDYYFKAVTNQNIQVNGDILPLVASIITPTNPLSFTLDPNQEDGQQFIAPNFTLTNETLAPLQIELKSFEQTTDVLNDVLPDAHENWNELNKTESQGIALALEPIPSDNWLSLVEGPRYVANTTSDELGVIKPSSRVDFTFNALHGQSFEKALNPQYQLTFVFGFSQ